MSSRGFILVYEEHSMLLQTNMYESHENTIAGMYSVCASSQGMMIIWIMYNTNYKAQ